ncbi:dUTP diphosphatase [Sulfitobacter aestuarii]|uniref:Deoxyuridine 5'-triphosphate nucleotidohydrolase n=1 Tax=Sulfitobacter aestuarii TaxID=2161676 RepID=A0ABW5U6D5_9RHOB
MADVREQDATVIVRVMWEPGADRSLGLPAYASDGAAGADLRANLPEGAVTLAPGQRALIGTGLRLEIPPGHEVQLRPRSGLALKHGLMLANSPGTIDADYRGPLGVILLNGGQEPFLIEHGMRIAQMVVAPVLQATFQTADTVDETARGSGGFGSTGIG